MADKDQQNRYPVDKDTANTARAANQEDNMDNPIIDEEAQNVTDGAPRMSGKEAEQATRKANEGKGER